MHEKEMCFPRLIVAAVAVILIGTLASGAVRLPDEEVEALNRSAIALGKKNWDFNVNPCSTDQNSTWFITQEENAVTCDCTFNNNSVCHIVSIYLKGQSLPGTLPPELARLPYLRVLDLTLNYLSGSIPSEWGSMQLTNISLYGNRLTGPIPKHIGNISTLEEIVLEFNQLSGPIPSELGTLFRIKRICLTSNNFSGELPETLAELTALKDFRIGDNHFTGKIPDLVEKWTNLNRLYIQASGMDGPIPSGIALLTNLTDLRISNLNGSQSTFPPLDNTKNLKYLILRSCNIIGELPDYLQTMTSLRVLSVNLTFSSTLLCAPPKPAIALKFVD